MAVVLGALALVFTSSKASLSADSDGLAQINMPLGGGTVESVSVMTTGKHAHPVATTLQGDEIVPTGKVSAHKLLNIVVVVQRPGWLSWLTGKRQTLRLSVMTPVASLESHFLTVHGSGSPLTLTFEQPVSTVSYGSPGHMKHLLFNTPRSQVQIPRPALAGTEQISATIRPWEKSKSAAISWFPAGAGATAIATPAPGGTISADTPITLTFSKPIAKALAGHMPVVTPAGSGSWRQLSSHAIKFIPSGYGYGIDASVDVALPSGVQLVGGHASGSAVTGHWTVPPGSTLRLQQLLSQLGYLPFKMTYTGKPVATTPLAQEKAATIPPHGTFNWAYPNVPSALRGMWQPGAAGTMTKGAVMAFENNLGMSPDGVAGATVWRSLINAADANKVATFGYTFVSVSEGSPETESTWHNGKTVVSGPVNTGISAAPTAQGVFPVFEHALSVTMSGTNPDGSHYSDPGVPYVSYFNGGDALHGFIRPGYGYPQSLGCVEMPYSEAASVYPYTPIGTLVDVS